MYRSILVPLDGTAFGEHALVYALAVARRTRAQLHLVHVHVPGALLPLDSIPFAGVREEELRLDADRAYVAGLIERIGHADGPAAEVRLLDGPIAQTLAGAANDARVDLVVMSTHGHAGLSRLWHRGVAAYLTRHLSVPLLMVHAPAESSEPPADASADPELRHVLVPLGGAAYSEQVLEHAVALGRPFDARYTLLKVVEPPVQAGYTLTGQDGHVNHVQLEKRRDEASGYLDRIAAGLRARGLNVATAVVSSANAPEAIVRWIDRAGTAAGRVDVVAMETHGLGGAAHLFNPGVVEHVVHECAIPVLVHHAAVPDAVRTAAFEESARDGTDWVQAGAAAA